MTHTLSITDGTTTVSLTTGSQYLVKYVPEASLHGEDVRESATVGFTGATIQAAVTTLRSLNQLFEQAYRWDKYKTGAKVYVNFEPDGTGTNVFRALLRDASINLNAKTLKEHWGARNLELEIEMTRQGYWEGPETALSLTSFATALNTTVTVGNKSDTDAGNYVQIASTDIVLGDLPAPMKLTVTNASPTTDGYDSVTELYVFHNVDSNPASLSIIYEAENATAGGTPTTDAISSNYGYSVIANPAALTEALVLRWTMTAAQLDLCAGGRFAFLTAVPYTFPSTDVGTANNYFRFKINNISYTDYIYSGAQTLANATGLTFIDTARILPSLIGQSGLESAYLELYKTASTTDNNYPLDFVAIAPISSNSGWIKIETARGIDYNEAFILNEYDDINYIYASTLKGALAIYGGPILLVPNKTQRLYLFGDEGASRAYRALQKYSVSISYRPRYRNL